MTKDLEALIAGLGEVLKEHVKPIVEYAMAAEREACAKVAYHEAAKISSLAGDMAAAAIRARKP